MKKNYIIISLIISIIFMVIGYINLANVVSLENKNSNSKLWDVRIIDFKLIDSKGNVNELSKPYFTEKVAFYNVLFEGINDSVTYEVTIKNYGKIDAKLDSYIISPNNDNFDIKIDNTLLGEKLLSKETVKKKITISPKTNEVLKENQSIIFNYVQR